MIVACINLPFKKSYVTNLEHNQWLIGKVPRYFSRQIFSENMNQDPCQQLVTYGDMIYTFSGFIWQLNSFYPLSQRHTAGLGMKLAVEIFCLICSSWQIMRDKNLEDNDIEPAPKLIEVVFQNCRGQVDHWVKFYIEITVERLRVAERPYLKCLLVQVVSNIFQKKIKQQPTFIVQINY